MLYLSDYIIKHKTDYYRLLQEVRTTNKWEDWVLFSLKGVEETAKQILAIKALFVKTQEMIKSWVDRIDVSRVTAAKYLKGLEKIGALTSKKVWKETLYVNRALFDLLKR